MCVYVYTCPLPIVAGLDITSQMLNAHSLELFYYLRKGE